MRGIKQNLVGKRFGKVNVLEYKGVDKNRNRLWICKCDCGREFIELGTFLTKGYKNKGSVYSCGICSPKYMKNVERDEVEDIDTSFIGQKFGKLTIQEVFWKEKKRKGVVGKETCCKCICDCGNEKIVTLINLKKGTTKSCGCLKSEVAKGHCWNISDDFIGQKFGKLTVVAWSKTKHKWKCKCSCGNIKYLDKSALTRKKGYRSCGNCYGKITRNRSCWKLEEEEK